MTNTETLKKDLTMPCVTSLDVYPAEFSANYEHLTPTQQDEVLLLFTNKVREVVRKDLTDQWKQCIFPGLITRGLAFARLDEMVMEQLPPPTDVGRLWTLRDIPQDEWVPVSATEHETTKVLQTVARGGGTRTDHSFPVQFPENAENPKTYTCKAEFKYVYRRASEID